MDLHTSTSRDAQPRVERTTPEPEKQFGGVGLDLNLDHSSTSNSGPEDIEKDAGSDQRPAPAQDTSKNDLVEFDGPDDPSNPKNWTPRRRWAITISMASMTFVVTFASSIFSVAIDQVAEEYDISRTTSILGVSLFLLVG